jgi:hypothetical protein
MTRREFLSMVAVAPLVKLSPPEPFSYELLVQTYNECARGNAHPSHILIGGAYGNGPYLHWTPKWEG